MFFKGLARQRHQRIDLCNKPPRSSEVMEGSSATNEECKHILQDLKWALQQLHNKHGGLEIEELLQRIGACMNDINSVDQTTLDYIADRTW